MKNLIGIVLVSVLLSGCITTASHGTRTEYEDKMKQIEQDYQDKRITRDEYIELKERVNRQAKTAQQSSSVSPD